MIFKKQAEKDFQVKDITSAQMMAKITECANIYRGAPYWADPENRIKTINFAKAVCSETARLVTLGIKIQIDGGARGAWLQEQITRRKHIESVSVWLNNDRTISAAILYPVT